MWEITIINEELEITERKLDFKNSKTKISKKY